MRVRWDGPRVVSRAVGELEWSIRTDFVQEVDTDLALELLTKGATQQEILEDYPDLEAEDIQASLLYATHLVAGESS